MLYFAYGSNMSRRRLTARTPSAERLGTCWLHSHQVRFHKIGWDGSAKCDAFHTRDQQDRVWGVLYRLDPAEKPILDRIEGLGSGYEIKTVELASSDGRTVRAFTYYATAIDASLRPFDWYLHHVLQGAQDARLPEDYVRALAITEMHRDPDRQRAAREFALHRAGRVQQVTEP
jgi:gamma-glutamylcyclotransferase